MTGSHARPVHPASPGRPCPRPLPGVAWASRRTPRRTEVVNWDIFAADGLLMGRNARGGGRYKDPTMIWGGGGAQG